MPKKTYNQKSDTNSKIRPLGDRILVKPLSSEELEKKNQFGIIIPETVDKEKPEQGKVIAVGEGRYENGKIVPMKIKIGDRVLFSKYGFDEVKIDEEELYILKEESILAVIK
jgi:chaperonin GroES